jgi:ParB/RepB/Spo0J family partition protein
MMLAINTIHENPDNARHVEATFSNEEMLRSSMAMIGLLQPILVRPHPEREGHWMIRAGHRRFRAARHLGWTEIDAVEQSTQAPETAISAAENMVRSSMHAIDQWRAIRDLQDRSGYSLETAAAAIGVSKALAQRMSVLGRMDESVLAELAKQPELPAGGALRTISAAPVERQRAAMTRANRDREGVLYWHEVANLCSIKKIPMERAIFDTKLIAWDEDFFAEADAGDRFTTSDIEAFMEAQRSALKEQIDKSNGRYVLAEVNKTGNSNVKLPGGWHRDYNPIPKRFAKDDPRKVYATINTESDYRLGVIDYAMAAPSERQASGDDLLEGAEVAQLPDVNKATLTRIAEMKAEAVRAALLQFKGNGAADMLRALLLLFTMKTVVAGSLTGSPHNTIAQALVLQDGQPNQDVQEEDLCDMAAFVIREAISFDHPKTFNGPGKGAEWLATAIDAQMPRTDTKDILRGLSAAKLQAVAQEQGIDAMRSPSDLRKAMTGKMANWRLVTFGAPGPIREENAEEDQDAAA